MEIRILRDRDERGRPGLWYGEARSADGDLRLSGEAYRRRYEAELDILAKAWIAEWRDR